VAKRLVKLQVGGLASCKVNTHSTVWNGMV